MQEGPVLQTPSLNQLPEARNFTIDFHPCFFKMKYPRALSPQPSLSQHEPISQILSREALSRKRSGVYQALEVGNRGHTRGAFPDFTVLSKIQPVGSGTQPKRGALPRAGQITTVSCYLQPLELPRAQEGGGNPTCLSIEHTQVQ